MSYPVLPESRIALGRRRALLARFAVAAARVLTLFPPTVIRRVLVTVVRGAGPAAPADVLHWRTAVNTVSRRCAGQGCLQRSVAVMLLARCFGVAPVWKTGFRPCPFVAHAWVEAGGAPVGEPEAVADFRAVMAVDPEAVQ